MMVSVYGDDLESGAEWRFSCYICFVCLDGGLLHHSCYRYVSTPSVTISLLTLSS